MVQEIIYTSAPKGLRQGSRGFCTVVSTAGMAANLAERLESMSGYRHAFPLHDPNVGLNPICYAHVTTRMAGQKLNVISRVADAGQDYSGRTNKLAHHIVLDDAAALPAGPGRVLAETSNVVTQWDGKLASRAPRTLTSPKIPEVVHLSAWKLATGDGGWAGYVAEQLLSSRAPVNIIFAPGTDTLALLLEILDLIPIPQRWGITFSTYFTRLLAGTECQLRFFLDGTSEATSLRNDARAVTVDLTRSMPAATGGRMVELARAGVLEFRQSAPAPVPQSARPSGPRPAVSNEELSGLLDADAAAEDGESADTYRLQSRTPDARPVAGGPPPISRLEQAFGQKQVTHGPRNIAVMAFLLLCALGAGAYFAVPPMLKSLRQRQELAQKEALDGAAEPTADAVANQPMVPPVALPFDGRSPFAELKSQHNGQGSGIKLPPLEDTSEQVLFPILTGDLGRVDFEFPEGKDDLSFAKGSGAEVTEWKLSGSDQRPFASLSLKPVSGSEKLNVTWNWEEGVLRDDVLRAATYRLSGQVMRILVTAASDVNATEEAEVVFEVPNLFGGELPLAGIARPGSEQPLLWETEAEGSDELPLKTYSFESVRISVAHIDSESEPKVEILTDAEAKEFVVDCEKRKIGGFFANTLADGSLGLRWKWADSDTDDVSFLKGKYQLTQTKFELVVTREDSVTDRMPLQLKISPPPVFQETELPTDLPGLIALPNPIRKEPLRPESGPVFQLWGDEQVTLQLHPGINSLIKTPGRTLRLFPVEKDNQQSWIAQIVDDPDVITELARYGLEQVDQGLPHYRLTFEWLPQAHIGESGPAAAELVRWCPLIVRIGSESRVFLQRAPDRWIIPTWDRQKGFILEQGHSFDENRSGKEFAELALKAALEAGQNGRFGLTYTVPDSAGDIEKHFQGVLSVGADGRFVHEVWFPVDALQNLGDGEVPADSQHGLLRTEITLPDNDSPSPSFKLSTTGYAWLTLGRFEQSSELSKEWKKGKVVSAGLIERLPLLKVSDEIRSQQATLKIIVNKYRAWTSDETRRAERIIRQNKDALSSTKDEQQKADLRARISEAEKYIQNLAAWQESANQLLASYDSDDPKSAAGQTIAAIKALITRLEKVTLSLTLSMKLEGDHPVTITFVDARMEEPHDN